MSTSAITRSRERRATATPLGSPAPAPLVAAAATADLVDMWGEDSFPASDPPSNW